MTSTEADDEPIRVGRDVYAPDGTKIGTISQVYPPVGNSDETWIAVDAGVSDGPYLVPCDGAGMFSEGLQVRRSVEEVQGSPHVVVEEELSDAQLAELSEYYGVMDRTSLPPVSAQADEMPSTSSAPASQAADADSASAASGVAGSAADDIGEETDPFDGQPSAGDVTVSGADGEVDVSESDELRARRANARAAAGYDSDTSSTPDVDNPAHRE